MRTNNGAKYCSNDFDKFGKGCGIKIEKKTPYSQQQNGVAERMIRTLMEKARSMLNGARLEQKNWAEAIGTACYLINRSPTSALVDKTPMEAWSGHKSSRRYLRVVCMLMCQRRSEQNWTTKLSNVSSSDIAMV